MPIMQDGRDALLDRVCRGIAANRVPGLHFPGYFLGLHARGMDKSEAWTAIPYGPHCANANGDMNIAAIALLADMGPGAAMRMHLPPASRMATATLHLQFTGIPVRSDLECHARFDGFFEGAAVAQGRTSGRLIAEGKVVCDAVATFATPPAPPGTTLVPVPWTSMEQLPSPLAARDMAADEKNILKSARAALKVADDKRSFIEHLWAQIAKPRTGGGADNTVRIGPHIGNRVGHVQGGVMVGIAAASAVAALPAHARLTGASAWYISAGVGKALRVRSRILQQGRTIAVVRTEIIGDLIGGKRRRVLELVTSHAF